MDEQGYYSNSMIKDTSSGANRKTNTQSGQNLPQSNDANNQPNANANPPVNSNINPQQPVHSDGFTMITPVESRRNKLKSMAQKEEEDLQRWKELNRPGPIKMAPAMIGGSVSLDEARARQQVELRHSKLQKKLRKEEMDRQQRQSEEDLYERMKAKQRKEAERLEERRKEEERQRREKHQQEHIRATQQFLKQIERSSTAPVASTSTSNTPPWVKGQQYREGRRQEENTELQTKKAEQRIKSEILEEKNENQEEEMKRELKRGRLAFLDRLQGGATGVSVEQSEAQHPPVDVEENSRDRQTHGSIHTSSPQDPFTPAEPEPAHNISDCKEGNGSDLEWVVMKLQNRFSWYERASLEDIVTQCNGDYQQAYNLLV
ncbi:hypothetical protein UPYG_G00309080 [Umbra pygmaea]|uniref:Epithelial-stromal interaction protein 1 n=1 Tax=Umbra pygmaea TaxID=75934 RepID=A0ABD0W3V2_UMBPY